MKYFDSYRDHNIKVPITISIKASTADLLHEMAAEMGISLDEVLSVLAEDAVIGLEHCNQPFEMIRIPDKCSKNDLLSALDEA